MQHRFQHSPKLSSTRGRSGLSRSSGSRSIPWGRLLVSGVLVASHDMTDISKSHLLVPPTHASTADCFLLWCRLPGRRILWPFGLCYQFHEWNAGFTRVVLDLCMSSHLLQCVLNRSRFLKALQQWPSGWQPFSVHGAYPCLVCILTNCSCRRLS